MKWLKCKAGMMWITWSGRFSIPTVKFSAIFIGSFLPKALSFHSKVKRKNEFKKALFISFFE